MIGEIGIKMASAPKAERVAWLRERMQLELTMPESEKELGADPEQLAYHGERIRIYAAMPEDEKRKENAASREGTIKTMMDAYPIEQFPAYTQEYVEQLYDKEFPA